MHSIRNARCRLHVRGSADIREAAVRLFPFREGFAPSSMNIACSRWCFTVVSYVLDVTGPNTWHIYVKVGMHRFTWPGPDL